MVLIGMQILVVTATHKSRSFGGTGLIGKEWYKACQDLCDTQKKRKKKKSFPSLISCNF